MNAEADSTVSCCPSVIDFRDGLWGARQPVVVTDTTTVATDSVPATAKKEKQTVRAERKKKSAEPKAKKSKNNEDRSRFESHPSPALWLCDLISVTQPL